MPLGVVVRGVRHHDMPRGVDVRGGLRRGVALRVVQHGKRRRLRHNHVALSVVVHRRGRRHDVSLRIVRCRGRRRGVSASVEQRRGGFGGARGGWDGSEPRERARRGGGGDAVGLEMLVDVLVPQFVHVVHRLGALVGADGGPALALVPLAEEHGAARLLVHIDPLTRRLASDRAGVGVVVEGGREAVEPVVQARLVVVVVVLPHVVHRLLALRARVRTHRGPTFPDVPLAVILGLACFERDVVTLARRLAPFMSRIVVEDVLVMKVGPIDATVAHRVELLEGLELVESRRFDRLGIHHRLTHTRARDAGLETRPLAGRQGERFRVAEGRSGVGERRPGEAAGDDDGRDRASGEDAGADDRLTDPRGGGGARPLGQERLALSLDRVHG